MPFSPSVSQLYSDMQLQWLYNTTDPVCDYYKGLKIDSGFVSDTSMLTAFHISTVNHFAYINCFHSYDVLKKLLQQKV